MTEAGVKIRTVSWGPNDPQIIMTGKSGTWYSQVTLDLKLGGGGGGGGIENGYEAAVRTREPPSGPVVAGL